METELENEKIKREMLSLYFSASEISNLSKKKITDVNQFNTYVIINKNWFKEYKSCCDYDIFETSIKSKYKNQSENEIQKRLESIQIKYDKQKRNEILINIKSMIIPEIFSIDSINCPKNFVIVKIEFIEKLIINTSQMNKDIFKNYYYQILIGDNYIILRSNENPYVYFICVDNNDFYSRNIDYLLIFDNNVSNIFPEIQYLIKCKAFASSIQNGQINSTLITQTLFNCNNQKIGMIINLKYEREKNAPMENDISLKENSNQTKYILLCLFNILDLKAYFFNKENKKFINKISENKKSFARYFLDFFSNFQNNQIKSLENLEKTILSYENVPENQKNYFKLMDFIYNKLDIDLSKNSENKQIPKYEFDEKKSRKEFKQQNENGSIIQQLFYITQKQEIKCNCGVVSYHYNFLRLLHFDIEDWTNNSLYSVTEVFFQELSINTNNNKRYCNMCSKELEYKQKYSIIELQKMITVVLEGKYKNEININLFNDFRCNINNNEDYYMLICFINENEKNEYEVIFYEGYWQKYDDTYKKKNSINKLLFKPRVCFYQRLDINFLNNMNKNFAGAPKIFLLFTTSTNKRQVSLDVNPNMRFRDAIEELKNTYDWLATVTENTVFKKKKKKIDIDRTIEENGLKENDEIIIDVP